MNSIYGACSGYDHQASPEANKVTGIISLVLMALAPIVLLIALAYKNRPAGYDRAAPSARAALCSLAERARARQLHGLRTV